MLYYEYKYILVYAFAADNRFSVLDLVKSVVPYNQTVLVHQS